MVELKYDALENKYVEVSEEPSRTVQRHYFVYDTGLIDESVCVTQGRKCLKVAGGEYDEVWIHKHRHGGECIPKAMILGEFDALNRPVFNQHCYQVTYAQVEVTSVPTT